MGIWADVWELTTFLLISRDYRRTVVELTVNGAGLVKEPKETENW